MTYSILATCPETGFFGLAVASRFFAVGAVCAFSAPWGAVMSQALPNPELGHRGLDLLRAGHDAETVRDILVAQDRGIAQRQLHVIDTAGRVAAHTGADCVDWAGDAAAPGVSVAGNMLAGPAVVADTLAALDAGGPIVARLLAAMRAGEAAGGDKRGRQSAALRLQGPAMHPVLDLRADDHPDPLAELERLYTVARERYLPFSYGMPRPGRPDGILDRTVTERIIEAETGRHPARDVPIPEE